MCQDWGVAKAEKSAAFPASVLPRLRVMCGRDAALGPARVQLLDFVGETGSLRSAAARMGMAHMTAWKHVIILNGRFRSPVAMSKRGGKAWRGCCPNQDGAERGGTVSPDGGAESRGYSN